MRITIKNGVTGGKINAIPSKSDAHRLLICAALADKETRLICPFSSEDIDATAGVLVSLGAGITRDSEGFAVKPIEKLPESGPLDCGESGSTLRCTAP